MTNSDTQQYIQQLEHQVRDLQEQHHKLFDLSSGTGKYVVRLLGVFRFRF